VDKFCLASHIINIEVRRVKILQITIVEHQKIKWRSFSIHRMKVFRISLKIHSFFLYCYNEPNAREDD
jgi:hypothetical protein